LRYVKGRVTANTPDALTLVWTLKAIVHMTALFFEDKAPNMARTALMLGICYFKPDVAKALNATMDDNAEMPPALTAQTGMGKADPFAAVRSQNLQQN
jgi:hypothetical protein